MYSDMLGMCNKMFDSTDIEEEARMWNIESNTSNHRHDDMTWQSVSGPFLKVLLQTKPQNRLEI